MATKVEYLKFVDEQGREIPMSAAEKEKKKKKWGKWLDELGYLVVGIVVAITSSGTGGFKVKRIEIVDLAPNQRQNG